MKDGFELLEEKEVKKTAFIIIEALDLNDIKPWLAFSSALAVVKIIAKGIGLPCDDFDKVLKLLIKNYKDEIKP